MYSAQGISLRARTWVPAAIWLGFIFLMSTGAFSSRHTSAVIEAVVRLFSHGISFNTIGAIDEMARKCAHVTEYFVLGVLLFRAFHQSFRGERVWMSALLAMAALALYAASDEFHQTFVPSRTPSVADAALDSAGGLIAQAACVLRWKKRNLSRKECNP